MGSKVEYVDSSHMYATNYVRNSKAIGVLWGIFTICYAIIGVVAFVTPEWMGDTDTLGSENPARFGLWSSCYFGNAVGVVEDCQGRLNDLSTIPSLAGRVATVFAGLSVLIALITIVAMLLFFFFTSTTVFHLCGWMQVVSALCMIVAVAVYPAGWDAPEVMKTCGQTSGRYMLGDCGLRWAYLLAIIGCLDAVILAILAFILATRHVKLQAEPTYGVNGSVYKGVSVRTVGPETCSFEPEGVCYREDWVGDAVGTDKDVNRLRCRISDLPGDPFKQWLCDEWRRRFAKREVNGGFLGDAQSVAGSRKSLNLHPVLLMPQPGDADRYSEFSNRTGRSKASAYRPEYASSMQNFQL